MARVLSPQLCPVTSSTSLFSPLLPQVEPLSLPSSIVGLLTRPILNALRTFLHQINTYFTKNLCAYLLLKYLSDLILKFFIIRNFQIKGRWGLPRASFWVRGFPHFLNMDKCRVFGSGLISGSIAVSLDHPVA
jgi:hypothetical protein